MSDSKVKVEVGGNFLLAGLTILFVGLKLTGHIDWSWWWVLSPVLIPAVIGLGILAGALLWAFSGGRK
jgi:hypothetical protein